MSPQIHAARDKVAPLAPSLSLRLHSPLSSLRDPTDNTDINILDLTKLLKSHTLQQLSQAECSPSLSLTCKID